LEQERRLQGVSMNRLSAIDAVSPAMARVDAMLFHPFRLSTWLKLGFIGLLGGGVARFSGNFNFHGPMVPPRGSGQHSGMPDDPFGAIQRAIHSVHIADYAHIIMAVLITILVVALIFLYLFCRFRFVLFDSVISGDAVVGRGWRQYAPQANRYFGFWLVYSVVKLAVMGFIVGAPLWHAYKSGVFSSDNSLFALFEILASIALGVLAAALVFAAISTLMKDFIMPIMALDDLTLGDSWTALWRVIASEPGAWAAYLGLKLVLTIVGAIVMAIAGAIALLPALVIVGIPVGALAALGVVSLKAGSMAAAIALFSMAGVLAATAATLLLMFLSAPLTVFYASYAFYFFGGRYPKLGALLWPEPTPIAPVQQMAGIQPVV
jgi:hypothetical protein